MKIRRFVLVAAAFAVMSCAVGGLIFTPTSRAQEKPAQIVACGVELKGGNQQTVPLACSQTTCQALIYPGEGKDLVGAVTFEFTREDGKSFKTVYDRAKVATAWVNRASAVDPARRDAGWFEFGIGDDRRMMPCVLKIYLDEAIGSFSLRFDDTVYQAAETERQARAPQSPPAKK